MVSSGVVALALAALVQVACSSHIPPQVRYEEGCCPGQVIEKKYVVQRPVTETYTYQEPVYSKKCYQKSAGVDKQVVPQSYETAPVCQTQETTVQVPTTDLEVQNQPLCKRTCTTSRYVIQIPITETTCTNSPLCKQTVRSQNNVLTTVSKKTSCAKQQCTQNTIVEKPVFETVCQDYQQSINKVGTKTVFKPEVKKSCVQLPPYKCMKPVYDSAPVYDSSSAYGSASASASAYGSASVYDSASVCGSTSVSAPAVSYDVSSGSDYGSYSTGAVCVSPAPSSYDYASTSFNTVPAYSPAPCYTPSPAPVSCTCA